MWCACLVWSLACLLYWIRHSIGYWLLLLYGPAIQRCVPEGLSLFNRTFYLLVYTTWSTWSSRLVCMSRMSHFHASELVEATRSAFLSTSLVTWGQVIWLIHTCSTHTWAVRDLPKLLHGLVHGSPWPTHWFPLEPHQWCRLSFSEHVCVICLTSVTAALFARCSLEGEIFCSCVSVKRGIVQSVLWWRVETGGRRHLVFFICFLVRSFCLGTCKKERTCSWHTRFRGVERFFIVLFQCEVLTSQGGVVWCTFMWQLARQRSKRAEKWMLTANSNRQIRSALFWYVCLFYFSSRRVQPSCFVVCQGVPFFLVFCLFVSLMVVCGCQRRRITRFIRHTCGGVCGTWWLLTNSFFFCSWLVLCNHVFCGLHFLFLFHLLHQLFLSFFFWRAIAPFLILVFVPV